MQSSFSDLSTDFLFPKLHGMWAHALAGERLLQLVRAGQREALARALAPWEIDLTQRAEVQKRLTQHLIDVLARVIRITDRRTSAFYAAFIDRYFFENLRTILHYHYFPERDVRIEFLLIDSPHLPQLDVDALLEARSVHRFFRALPPHETRDALLPILTELDDSQDLFVAEGRLDRLFYKSLTAHAAALPRASRATGQELVGMEIDIHNLVMILRNASLYRLPQESLMELVIPDGALLDDEALRALTATQQQRLQTGRLPPTYRKALAPLVERELYESENALANVLYAAARRAFSDFNAPGRAAPAFPYLKRYEALNVGRVFEGQHFALDPGEITSMLIGVDHV